MRPELRCHAVLCRKSIEAQQIAKNLNDSLHSALLVFKNKKFN